MEFRVSPSGILLGQCTPSPRPLRRWRKTGRRKQTGREDARRRVHSKGVEARRRVREHQLARPRAADAVVRARAAARRRWRSSARSARGTRSLYRSGPPQQRGRHELVGPRRPEADGARTGSRSLMRKTTPAPQRSERGWAFSSVSFPWIKRQARRRYRMKEGARMTRGMSKTSAASRAPKVATSATMTSGRLPPLAKCYTKRRDRPC